jgi:hypothetical protein
LVNRHREFRINLPHTQDDAASPSTSADTQEPPLYIPPRTPERERDEAEQLAEEILDRILADINIDDIKSEDEELPPAHAALELPEDLQSPKELHQQANFWSNFRNLLNQGAYDGQHQAHHANNPQGLGQGLQDTTVFQLTYDEDTGHYRRRRQSSPSPSFSTDDGQVSINSQDRADF